MIGLALNIVAFIFLAYVAFMIVCHIITGCLWLITYMGRSNADNQEYDFCDFDSIQDDGKTMDVSTF